jgi:hypothetical protein
MTSSADAAHGKRVPDFFIVGSPRTGTTSLHRMLREHPQIYMPELKEPRFLEGELWRRPDPAMPRESLYPTTLEDYLALFDDAAPEQLAGEASPSYLWSALAASNIAELQPAARIVATLREPASFVRSFHLQCLRVGNEDEKDLRTAIALEADRREGKHVPRHARRPQELWYSQHVRYVEQLQQYRARFAPEQMLVLIYDDYLADSRGTVGRVLRFLGVDDELQVPVRKANQSVSVRSKHMQAMMQAIAAGRGPVPRAAHRALKTLAPRRVRDRSGAIRERLLFNEPPAPDAELMIELRRRYKPEVVALSEYLDRDLVSLWGYDELG